MSKKLSLSWLRTGSPRV